MITRAQVVEAAKAYVDTPYRHQGRDAQGLDCVGLLIRVAHDIDYTDFDFTDYGQNPDGETMGRLLNEHLDKLVDVADAGLGDIISVDFGEGEQHVGIKTRESGRGIKYDYFVHALRDHGVREGRLFGKYLKGVKSAYRLRGLVD